ncbi:serine/threonine protein kinase [Haliangium ochraceum]|uniref:Serine/threonine protein kinase n=1 Tax=Haliangium ochraceum (strain DSM 14365 / JCM 11303 / SMP-2) TaxID=502025 RepID=D0LHI0_HALO1|nr:serine/threonine-protein kinase [Haliangium ochraceum]ACY12842.1 serine/threonine protein kinase [Haliangium ochraceum DSM 14365]
MLDTRIGGYRITKRIAKGGMGEVYLARHELMEREAAIKVLHPDLSGNEQQVNRFLNEARATASIRHPGIVEIFDVGHEGARAYIVMEYLRGEMLASRLARTRIEIDKALQFTRQIAGALGAAHACGIIHRDLKPENIFVVPDPDVIGGERTKILDFGIAKLLESRGGVHTVQGTMFGTPAYMAPEQCEDAAQVDRRADLYALGCILYEFLCGTPPFGRGGIELVAAHLRDVPTPVRDREPRVSEALDAVVMRLLAKDPEQRYGTCEALVRALDQVPNARTPQPELAFAETSQGIAGDIQHAATATAQPGVGRVSVKNPGTEPGAIMNPGTAAGTSVAAATSPGQDGNASTHGGAGAAPTQSGASASPAAAEPVNLPSSGPQPSGRGRGPGLWLAALVILSVVGGLVWWQSSGSQTPSAPVEAGPSPEENLERARQAMSARDWQSAEFSANEALRALEKRGAEGDDALIEEISALRRLAQDEQHNQYEFEKFQRAFEADELLDAVSILEDITAESVYRPEAEALLAPAREAWLVEQRAAAAEAAERGRCRSVRQINQAAHQLFPGGDPEIEEQLANCREQRRDDDDDKAEEPAKPSRPTRPRRPRQGGGSGSGSGGSGSGSGGSDGSGGDSGGDPGGDSGGDAETPPPTDPLGGFRALVLVVQRRIVRCASNNDVSGDHVFIEVIIAADGTVTLVPDSDNQAFATCVRKIAIPPVPGMPPVRQTVRVPLS